jgi:hypothetical protein
VRRLGLDGREDLDAGELNLRGQRCLVGDDEFLAQVRGHGSDRRDQPLGRIVAQDTVGEMLA